MQIPQHRPEAWPEDVAALSEKAAEVGTGIFEVTAIQRYGKAHFRCFGTDAQMGKQRRQIRIGSLVIDDETRINRDTRGIDRIAVATRAGRALIKRNPMAPAQEP